MAGFLCIWGEESLAPVLPFPNWSSLITWTDRCPPTFPGVIQVFFLETVGIPSYLFIHIYNKVFSILF